MTRTSLSEQQTAWKSQIINNVRESSSTRSGQARSSLSWAPPDPQSPRSLTHYFMFKSGDSAPSRHSATLLSVLRIHQRKRSRGEASEPVCAVWTRLLPTQAMAELAVIDRQLLWGVARPQWVIGWSEACVSFFNTTIPIHSYIHIHASECIHNKHTHTSLSIYTYTLYSSYFRKHL